MKYLVAMCSVVDPKWRYANSSEYGFRVWGSRGKADRLTRAQAQKILRETVHPKRSVMIVEVKR